MEERAGRKRGGTQIAALVLLVLGLAGGFGYYFLAGKQPAGFGSPQVPAMAAGQGQKAGGGDASCAAGSAQGSQMAGGSPVSQAGALLGVQVFAGHAPASTGSGAGIEAITDPKGPGASAGLQAKDVVVAANGTPVTCPSGLLESLNREWPKGKVALTVERKGKTIQVELAAKGK